MRATTALAFVLCLSSAACGFVGSPQQQQDPQTANDAEGGRHHGRQRGMPKESQDFLRKSEIEMYAKADAAEDERLDKLERDALKSLRIALGKESHGPGTPMPESSSTALKKIKAANIKVRLEPVVNQDGRVVNDDFFMMKDSFTDRLQQLQRKIVAQTASKAEMREIQEGSKHVMELNDLRMQVMNVSTATMNANTHVQMSSMGQMLRVSHLVRSRKQMSMELNDEDHALIKRGLDREKRATAIAATDTAMLAAYQAVLNDGGDPKALDVIAEGALKAFPVTVSATDEDARAYVASLSDNVAKTKVRYEAWMRKIHGDAKYERQYKAQIDNMFKQAESAKDAKSYEAQRDEQHAKNREDVAKCKRGEDPGAGSAVAGPTCKAIRQAAQSGDTSQLLPGTRSTFEETGGPNPGVAAAKLAPGKAGSVIDGAGALARGDVDGALDVATKAFPPGSVIGSSLEGIAALKKGDARGAIKAAVNLVPIPGLKDVFGLASSLLFGKG